MENRIFSFKIIYSNTMGFRRSTKPGQRTENFLSIFLRWFDPDTNVACGSGNAIGS
jgi:hypothetical protein